MDRRGGLKRKLIDLNDQFATWVNEQHAQCRTEIWLDGVDEYRRISQELIASSKQLLEQSSAAPDPVDKVPEIGSKSAPFLSFGKSPATDQPEPPKDLGTRKVNGGSFNFSTPKPDMPRATPFTFGATPVAFQANGFGNKAPEESAVAAEEEDEPSAPIAVDPSAEVIFSGQATLNVQTPNESKAWMSKGKGKLTLRRPDKLDAKPCHLVFTTESGRVLINASLYKGLKPVLQEKGRLLLTLFLGGDAGEDSSRVVLIRLAAGKNQELADLITKHSPQ